MNKLTLAVVLGLGLTLPLGAMASTDEEVTIRVMQMNENSSDNVTRYIKLPDVASDEAKEQAQFQNHERVRETMRKDQNQKATDDADATQEQILEQERIMEQERERWMERYNIEDRMGDMPNDQGGQSPGGPGM